jgi:Fur family transcriptional regulator, ferric uptake regulator
MDHSELLKSSKLSLTSQRLGLLNILASCNRAISEKELEDLMKGSCNRTTIYRNLNSLVEKKIVHRILSEDAVKYRLVKYTSVIPENTEHVHFECRSCNTTFCLEDIAVQEFSLPEGFTQLESHFIVIGICKNCCNEKE